MTSTTLNPISPSHSNPEWAASIQQLLESQFAKRVANATPDEMFRATSAALRPQIVDAMLETEARFRAAKAKTVFYLSMEFLLGRSLRNNLQSLNLYETFGSGHAFAMVPATQFDPNLQRPYKYGGRR